MRACGDVRHVLRLLLLALNAWQIRGHRCTSKSRCASSCARSVYPALTANIVNSTIGAGIFALPAVVAAQIGAAAPLAYLICAGAMCLFVSAFAMAGSRVSLTGGLYAYVEVAFGSYFGFLAGALYFLTAILAISGIVSLTAASVGGLIPALATPAGRFVVTLGDPSLSGDHQRSRRQCRRAGRGNGYDPEAGPVVDLHHRGNFLSPAVGAWPGPAGRRATTWGAACCNCSSLSSGSKSRSCRAAK